MKGRWRRLGHLPLDTSRAPWAATHAALPIAEPIAKGSWCVYLSLRDGEGRARIGRTLLTLGAAPELAPLEPEPVLDLGKLGTFDDSGVTTSCILSVAERRYLYYTGWTRGVSVPFYLQVGLAVSENGGPFSRWSPAPLLDRNASDPYLTASPCVRADSDGWRMWYISGSEWKATGSGVRHYYNVRYAESEDGILWRRDGRTSVDYANDTEHAFARPCVMRDADRFRMWYAVRGDRYTIGYAESVDGIDWSRLDDVAGLEPAGHGWESEMVEYPWIFDADGRRYMLYNGNDYGRSGVGFAVWDSD